MPLSNFKTILFSINTNLKQGCRKIFFYKIFFLLSILTLMGSFKAFPQQNVNYPLYANIIYRFTKYINWPNDKRPGEFIIGVLGDTPLYEELKNFTGDKWVGNKKIVIKRFPVSTTSFDCQILFIGEEESRSMKKIVAATTGAPTLLVSESDGLARKGAGINFTVVDDHLKLEINKKNIEQRNLDVASEFFALGTIVK